MPTSEAWHLLLSCEHGGNIIPKEALKAFAGAKAVLMSHRGWDKGALQTARVLKNELNCPMVANEISRLLVDCNRSAQNAKAFSEWSRGLDQEALLKKYHIPYWRKVRQQLKGRTLHLSVHSFTPVFHGYRRKTDIGILFDSKRVWEAQFAADFKRQLQREFPKFAIHLNRPYRGSGDGLTTSLRQELSKSRYLGIEIEFNQRRKIEARKVARALIHSGWISQHNRD